MASGSTCGWRVADRGLFRFHRPHAVFATSSLPSGPDYVVTKTTWPAVQWRMESTDAEVALVTSRLRVTVHRSDGSVEYHDAAGKRLLQEGTRT